MALLTVEMPVGVPQGSLVFDPDFAQEFFRGSFGLLGLFMVAVVKILPSTLRVHIHLKPLSHWPNKTRCLHVCSLALLDCTSVSIP